MADPDSVARLRAAVARVEMLLDDMPDSALIETWLDPPTQLMHSDREEQRSEPESSQADAATPATLSDADWLREDARTVAAALRDEDLQKATDLIVDAERVADGLRSHEAANAAAMLAEAERVAIRLQAERRAAGEALLDEARQVAARLTSNG